MTERDGRVDPAIEALRIRRIESPIVVNHRIELFVDHRIELLEAIDETAPRTAERRPSSSLSSYGPNE